MITGPSVRAPAVDTVLVAYNSDDVIEDAVHRAKALGGDVVVVDHGGGRSARRAAALGATAVNDPANPGFGAGQNRGVALTSSPYVLLCNPDAQIRAGAVAAGAMLLDARPDAAAVQGVIMNASTGEPERSAGVEVGPVHLLGRALGARRLLAFGRIAGLARRLPVLSDHVDRVPDAPVEVASLAATVLLVRRGAFEAVGGFDDSYFLYGEDLDLCRRLRRYGWRLVAVPDVWAVHAGGGSADSTWDRELNWWRGTMRFSAHWWGRGAWAVALAAAGLRWARLAVRHPAGGRSAARALVLEPIRERRTRVP